MGPKAGGLGICPLGPSPSHTRCRSFSTSFRNTAYRKCCKRSFIVTVQKLRGSPNLGLVGEERLEELRVREATGRSTGYPTSQREETGEANLLSDVPSSHSAPPSFAST